jgi:clan AA aspartic protease (TIGR02281 family)
MESGRLSKCGASLSAISLYAILLAVACLLSTEAGWADDNYAMAVSLYTAKRYAESEKLLARNVVIDPANVEAHYYLASCYHYQHKNGEAKKEYEYIVKNFPGSQAATYALQALGSLSLSPDGDGKIAAAAMSGPNDDFIPDEEWVPYTRGPSGHFYVKATINGHTQEIMMDTGAEMTVLNSNQWRQLGMPLPTGRHDGSAAGVAGSVNLWNRNVEISLGKIRRHVKVAVLDSPTAMALLGESFFGDLEFNMDSRAGYIHFFKKGHKSSANALPYNSIDIPFRHIGKNMLITAKINGMPIDCIFDTGAFGVLLGMNHITQMGIHFPPGTMVGKSSGVVGSMTTYFFPIDSIEVGDIKKTNFGIAVSATSQAIPLLGQSFFGDRKYVIDNEKMLIRFAR